MSKKICLLILALLMVTTSKAFAFFYVASGMQRLGPSLKNARVVYGTVQKVTTTSSNFSTYSEIGPGMMANVHVEKVLTDQRGKDGSYKKTKFQPMEPADIPISCHASLQDWPSNLVPVVEGKHCILVCGPAGEIRTALPAGDALEAATVAGDEASARRVLESELSRQIATEKNIENLRNLIAQFADVAITAGAKDTLTPFLKSNDSKLRRAALAGLTYITEDPAYVSQATADLSAWFKGNNDTNYPEVADVFNYYFFLQLNDAFPTDSRKAASFLPLYRVILDSTNDYDHGLDPIARLGTKDDIARLYRYRKGEVRYRQTAVQGLSRILQLGFPNYGESDYLKNEAEYQRWIERIVNAKKAPVLLPNDPRMDRFANCYFSYNDWCYTEHPDMAQTPADVVARLMARESTATIPIKYQLKGREMNRHYCRAQAEFNKGCLYENAALNAKSILKDNSLYAKLHNEAMTAAKVALGEVLVFSKQQGNGYSDPNLAKCHALLGNDAEAIRASKDNPYVSSVITLLFIEGRFDAAKSLMQSFDKHVDPSDWGTQMLATHKIMLAHIAQTKHDDAEYQSNKNQAVQLLKKVPAKKLASLCEDLRRMNIDPSAFIRS